MRKKFLTLIHILITGLACTFGQQISQPNQFNADYNLGKKYYNQFAYRKAIKLFLKAYEQDTVSTAIKLSLAQSHYKMRDMKDAEYWANKIVATEYEPTPDQIYYYIEILASNQHYDEAAYWYSKYVILDSLNEDRIDRMKGFLMSPHLDNNASEFRIQPISVNSDKLDFSPAFFQDGLVFVSGRKEGPDVKKFFKNDGVDYLTLFYSKILNDGEYSNPELFNKKLRSSYHEGPVAFYNKGTKLIFTQSNITKRKLLSKRTGKSEDGSVVLKLYMADYINGKIENITPFEYNSDEFSTGHPTISEDGSKLIYSSNRPDSNGGSDLYISYRINDKAWTPPTNLGEEINTSGSELFPHLNGNVLYFASDGHRGIGGLDVYHTILVNDKPSEIIAMNYPLNSASDDYGFITKDGRIAYFSSNRGNELNDEIYYAEYYRPKPPLTVNITAIDSASSKLLGEPEFQLIDTSTYEHLIPIYVNGDSLYTYVLDTGIHYKVIANNTGYFTKQEFRYSEDSISGELNWQILMKKIIPNEPIELKDILYDFDKATLRDSSMIELNYLINWLEDNPSIRIELHSHTDSFGSAEYNLKLSERRAESVVEYLSESGIDAARLVAKGFGESQPLIPCPVPKNCTKQDHQKNRRTEFMVIEELKPNSSEEDAN